MDDPELRAHRRSHHAPSHRADRRGAGLHLLRSLHRRRVALLDPQSRRRRNLVRHAARAEPGRGLGDRLRPSGEPTFRGATRARPARIFERR